MESILQKEGIGRLAVKIVADSTAYLPHQELEKWDITVVSLAVNFPEATYREVDISNEEFFRLMAESPQVPTSSQPPLLEMQQAFLKHCQAGHQVLGIFLSGELSGTYQTALAAKNLALEEMPEAKIEIIDSQAVCMKYGFAVLGAARAAAQGLSLDQVIERTNDILAKSRLIFVPDTLEYLRKGGRIGGAAALLGTLLQVKPILTLIDGKVTVWAKVRTREKAIHTIFKEFEKDRATKGIEEAIIHHINCEDQARELAQNLAERIGQPVDIAPIGPVIGLHAGPGTLGIAYYTKN